jgi:iron complex outermembrane receptor protein
VKFESPIRWSLVAVILAVLGPVRTLAQTPQDTASAKLGELVVSASRGTKTLEQMAVHTSIITNAEIRESPAQTTDQLLREIPGINMPGAPYYTTDPTGQQTRMRGITNSTVLVLLDGIPIHDPFFNTTQWFKVPLSSIDHIEVVRGGASSTWGNLAVAGLVNIITRKPKDNSGEIGLNYGTFGTEDVSAAKNILASKSLAIRLSGDLLNTDGYQTTAAGFLSAFPGKGSSSATNYNAQLAAYYTPSSSFSGFVRGGYHQQNEDVGGYTFGTNLQKSPDAAAGFTAALGSLTHLDVRGWGQWESFNKQNGAGCFLASSTACNTTATASPLVQYMNSHDYNPYREAGASAVISTALLHPSAAVQFGLDFRRVAGEDTATTFNKPTADDVRSATINRIAYGQGAQRFLAAFGQFTIFPTSKLQATLSLRYDDWTNSNGIAELTTYSHGTPDATVGGPIANTEKNQFDPSLTMRYAASDRVSFRGAAYRGFRAPGLNNLYRSFSSTTSITIANPHLLPQTLTGGEIGLDLTGQRVTFGITGFVYNTSDLIASFKVQNAATAPADVLAICGADLSNCPATVNYNTNSQDATSKGIETELDWQLARRVDVNASYTYTSSYYTSTHTGDPVNIQLGAIPNHVATVEINWRAASRLTLHGATRYSSAMFLDINQTIPQGAFATVDLGASAGITPRIDLYLSGTNLTNVVYSDNATTSASSATLGMGRALTGGLRWRF